MKKFSELFIILFLHQTTTHVLQPLRDSTLFIILFLHQTTTLKLRIIKRLCCLSSCSYIKPQLARPTPLMLDRCLSSCSYIKPQLRTLNKILAFVVYHLVPTSNHNYMAMNQLTNGLFIILFLHQTTTEYQKKKRGAALFIILFLHQTTTSCQYLLLLAALFIILFLHQTTTRPASRPRPTSCLSSCSYIKPQP